MIVQRNHQEQFSFYCRLLMHINEPAYFMSLISSYIGASASALWIRDEFTSEEFRIYACHNRKDILQEEEKVFFRLSDQNANAKECFRTREILIGEIGKDPFGPEWLKKVYTSNLPSMQMKSIILIPIFDNYYKPFGVLSAYSEKTADRGNSTSHLNNMAKFLYLIFKEIIFEIEAIHSEQRKTAHEIDAASRSTLNSLAELIKLVKSDTNNHVIQHKKQITNTIGDTVRSINIIRESIRHQKYSDSIKEIKKTSEFLDFREAFNSAAQPLIKKQPPSRVHLSQLRIDTGSIKLLAARIHLREILNNVVSNSIKYSVDGSAIRSEIFQDIEKNAIFITSNRSVGMPKDEWKKVWLPRYRGSNAKAGVEHGDGIGLSIVRDICEEYGFSYDYSEVRDADDEGSWSRIKIIFPAKTVEWGSAK